jgi:hypothetical protein
MRATTQGMMTLVLVMTVGYGVSMIAMALLAMPLTISVAPASSAVPGMVQSNAATGVNPAPAVAPAPASASPGGAAAAKPADSSAGGLYHNGALGFSYPYPKGWTVATPEMIRSANASMKEAKPAAQNGATKSGQSGSEGSAKPGELIFYAYGAAKDDGTFRMVPSVRITSLESYGAMVTPEAMKRDALAQEKMGMKIIHEPEKFVVSDQKLYRMDFEDPRAGHTWVSIIETVAYDHVLTIEILAGSTAQLALLVSTVKDSVFADADKN